MTATKEIDLGEFNTGNVDRIRVTVKKDGAVWDLTNGTVTLTFEKPDRSTRFDRVMTPENASKGVFYYDTTISDLDTVGYWTLTVKVVDGSITKKYPYEIYLHVVDEP